MRLSGNRQPLFFALAIYLTENEIKKKISSSLVINSFESYPEKEC